VGAPQKGHARRTPAQCTHSCDACARIPLVSASEVQRIQLNDCKRLASAANSGVGQAGARSRRATAWKRGKRDVEEDKKLSLATLHVDAELSTARS